MAPAEEIRGKKGAYTGARHFGADQPRAHRGDRAFAALLYGEHPYGHLAIGTETALQSITLDEVRTFHQRAYRPANATLIAAGDASHDELFASVEAAFGQWSDAAAAHHEFAGSLPLK